MKLINDFFTIEGKHESEGTIEYLLALNSGHFIYKAHFPGEPITPGVCIIQMVKELAEEHLGMELNVKKVKNVKFLNIISPVSTPKVTCLLTVNLPFSDLKQVVSEKAPISCSATIKSEAGAMTKLSISLIAAND